MTETRYMNCKKKLKHIASAGLCFMLIFSNGAWQPSITMADTSNEVVGLQSSVTINYKGQAVTLSAHALYVNAKEDPTCAYVFKTLQDAVAVAQPGTKEIPTVIYLEPDVYWTDDYTNPTDRSSDDLIGLQIPQAYITLAGMTGNPEDVVIASDRGQNAGADGNFNTIGVADGFHAKDVTIGNYCNVDLVYPLDSGKNHTKRQESITQAQAVTKVPSITDMDEWYFEHSNIISRLNLFSRDDRPGRSLLKDCHLECTDDSLGTGYITIFENCTFDLYSNTPCGGASFYMQAYLGCRFTTHLSDNKLITLCKNTKPFAFVDCAFNGDMTGMEWKQSNFSEDIRQIVSGNTLNGAPFTISTSRPQLSVTPDEVQMKAFKCNGDYNIYNLLNGAGYEEWDPLGQKDVMPAGAWNIQFNYTGITKDVIPVLEGNEKDFLQVSPVVLGSTDKSVTWSVEDNALSIEPQTDGTVIVKGNNKTTADKTGCLIATAADGMTKVLHFTVTPMVVEPPAFMQMPQISEPSDGKITVQYTYVDGLNIADTSLVNWYRASSADGSNKVLTAQTTYVKAEAVPDITYVLHPADAGSYIFCEVTPKSANSEAGEPVISTASRQITDSDIADSQKSSYNVDFEHLAYITAKNDTAEHNYEWMTPLESGNWYGGFYLPAEYRAGDWSDKAYLPKDGELPFIYSQGYSGAEGRYGFQTTTQGARLVYADDKSVDDMKMSVELSPHKTGAQGFGSAKQYMDIYIKYNAATMTGYGLRIARVPEISDPVFADFAAKSCTFTLMEYKNGVATPLENGVVSTAFLPGCSVTLDVTGNVFKADITTTTAQDSSYPTEMKNEVHLSHTFTEAVNTFSGLGFQHTGTAGAGKSSNRTTIESLNVVYGSFQQGGVLAEQPAANQEALSDNGGISVETQVKTGDIQATYAWMYAFTFIVSVGAFTVVYKKRENEDVLK